MLTIIYFNIAVHNGLGVEIGDCLADIFEIVFDISFVDGSHFGFFVERAVLGVF